MTERTPAPLPPRSPRPFAVHWGVDALAAFLLLAVLGLLLGVDLLVLVAGGLLVGLAVTPVTMRLERRGLGERARRDSDASEPPGSGPPTYP